jgi:hypothetical protein
MTRSFSALAASILCALTACAALAQNPATADNAQPQAKADALKTGWPKLQTAWKNIDACVKSKGKKREKQNPALGGGVVINGMDVFEGNGELDDETLNAIAETVNSLSAARLEGDKMDAFQTGIRRIFKQRLSWLMDSGMDSELRRMFGGAIRIGVQRGKMEIDQDEIDAPAKLEENYEELARMRDSGAIDEAKARECTDAICKAIKAGKLLPEKSPNWLAQKLARAVRSLATGEALAAEADPSDAQLQDRIRKLIEDLGSDDFQTREAATAALTEIGEPAVDALTEAAKSADPEVSNRAKRILGTE